MRRARRRLRGFGAILAVAVGTVLGVSSGHAGAQAASVDGWWLTAYGSMHVVTNGNHIVLERFDGYGNSSGHTETWVPSFCQLADINGGGGGAPGALVFVASLGQQCTPGYEPSTYYAWRNGGWYEGYYSSAGYTDRIIWGSGSKVRVW